MTGKPLVVPLMVGFDRLRWIESTLRWFARQDMYDGLHLADASGWLKLYVIVGEACGGGDAEELTPENLPVFVAAWNDLLAATGDRLLADTWAPKLFAQRIRQQPQRWNQMPEDGRVERLFDAAKNGGAGR